MKKLLLMIFGLTSCTAKLEYLSIDKEFTPRQLTSGYLLVVDPVMDDQFKTTGLRSSSGDVKQGDPSIPPIQDSESQVLGRTLLERIRKENKKLKADSLHQYKKIPTAAVEELMRHTRTTRDMPENFINTHSETFMKFPNPYRFIATVRIESESKSQDFYSRKEQIKNEKGEVELFNIDEWISQRKMTARMQIYDVKLKKQVFDGIQTRSVSSRRDLRTNESKGSLIHISLGERQQYPPFPERKELFQVLANDFAGNLPEIEDE